MKSWVQAALFPHPTISTCSSLPPALQIFQRTVRKSLCSCSLNSKGYVSPKNFHLLCSSAASWVLQPSQLPRKWATATVLSSALGCYSNLQFHSIACTTVCKGDTVGLLVTGHRLVFPGEMGGEIYFRGSTLNRIIRLKSCLWLLLSMWKVFKDSL